MESGAEGRLNRNPRMVFMLDDTEEHVLKHNGRVLLRNHSASSASEGEVIRVSGEKTYEVRVERSVPSEKMPSDRDYTLALLKEIE